MIQHVISLVSVLVNTNYPAGQYQKGLVQSKGENMVKIAKVIKTIIAKSER